MSNTLNVVVNEFVVPIAEVVLPVLAALAIHALRKWLDTKKVVLENEELRRELDELAASAVAYTEEISHKMARISGEKVAMQKKEDMAVNALLESAKAHNLTVARARQLVLTSLGSQFLRHEKKA